MPVRVSGLGPPAYSAPMTETPKKKHRLRKLLVLAGVVAAAFGYRNKKMAENERAAGRP